MSGGDLGTYAFLPWLRRGISTRIEQKDGDPVPGRATLRVTVGITGGPESVPIDVDLALLGPGDVSTFDARAISRHWPRPDVFEVEPNLFPLLELHPPDLAWRYTPATANTQDRLRPWLALIVLRDDEIAAVEPASAARPNAAVRTTAGTPLPPIDQLWAWAHVHLDAATGVTTGATLDAPALQGLIDAESRRAVARLLCPRRLDTRTAYTAFLVPTFEATRRSALRLPADPTLDAMAPAWANDGAPAELPIFYRWRFETGEGGDFASLAARVVARALPPAAGSRPMDESAAGMGLPAAATTALALESALRPLDSQSTNWPHAERQAWTTALATLLNLPTERLRQAGAPRTLAPPLYARWHAAASVLDPGAPPPWFQELNADPRLRVAAALGWTVVQREQQQLLAGAWAQVDAIREANARLRHAQLAREAAVRLYDRCVAGRAALSVMALTRPLHARVLMASGAAAAVTAQALIRQSPLRAGVLQAAYVKLARPLGPVGVRQGRPTLASGSAVVTRVNAGQLRIAPTPPTPTAMVTPARAAAELAPAWVTPAVVTALASLPTRTWNAAASTRSAVATRHRAPGRGTAPSGLTTLSDAALKAWPAAVARPARPALEAFLGAVRASLPAKAAATEIAGDLHRRVAVRGASLTGADVRSAPSRPGFVAQELQADGTLRALPASAAAEDTRFRAAVAAAFDDGSHLPAAGDVLTPIDVAATATALAAAVDPRVTIAATFGAHLQVAGGAWHPADSLDPVMAAPDFPQPLYEPLFKLSADWILTGLDSLPQDSVTVAATNERFIEAFMAGANDEMARTLLFNEFPTDQRGTYFRQFWDVSAAELPAPDINPIAAWPKTAALGENSSRTNSSALVLLLRAELLRRYPNLVIYAVPATWNADGSRSVSADATAQRSPEFLGTLGDGAGFWGFSLTTAEARGAASQATGAAGWYIALQEHPSEPRFGLEPPTGGFGAPATALPALAWSQLAADATSLAALAYVDLAAVLPDMTAAVDPAHAAWHVADGSRASSLAHITYREPARLLIHASRMIPADVA